MALKFAAKRVRFKPYHEIFAQVCGRFVKKREINVRKPSLVDRFVVLHDDLRHRVKEPVV